MDVRQEGSPLEPHSDSSSVSSTSSGDTWERPPLQDANTQIRLIRFLPGSGDDLDVSLEVYDRESAPAYNAISYTWGTEPAQEIIFVNGASVTVRPNCRYVLWQARYNFPEMPIWLDAICIDQDDMEERSCQVAIMFDIYEAAERVLACIGHPDDDSDAIKCALADIENVVQETPNEWYFRRDASKWKLPPDTESFLLFRDRFNNFSQRPYFSRLWIVQELVGGRGRTIVLCGTDQLDWDALLELSRRLDDVFNFYEHTSYPGECNEALVDLEYLVDMLENNKARLDSLIRATTTYQCHDVRDRIYGTLRLIDWTRLGISPPTPDYNISCHQLTLRMLNLFDNPSLDIVRDFVTVLQLGNPDNSLAKLLLHGNRGIDTSDFLLLQSDAREYSMTARRANLIRQNEAGRLFVQLSKGQTLLQKRGKVHEMLLLLENATSDVEAALSLRGLVPVYTSAGVFALASSQTCPGDIILEGCDTNCCDLVLRTRHDESSFSIVGQALVLTDFEPDRTNGCFGCACWDEDSISNYTFKQLTITFTLCDRDAILAYGSRRILTYGSGSVLSYLRHHALGKLAQGALVHDITLKDVEPKMHIGPPETRCPKHQLAEQYRIARQGLLYTLAVEGTGCVPIRKKIH